MDFKRRSNDTDRGYIDKYPKLFWMEQKELGVFQAIGYAGTFDKFHNKPYFSIKREFCRTSARKDS